MSTESLFAARRLVANAKKVVFLTGAGISTASGIPDYRGPDGVWTKNPGAEVKAHINVWMADSEVRRAGWQRRANMSWESVVPNAAHTAITEFTKLGTTDLVITQNIDGLHQRSGLAKDRLIEVHGTVHESFCMRCGHRGPIDLIIRRVEQGDSDPACNQRLEGIDCRGVLKAATIAFGQNLDSDHLEIADAAARNCDVFIAAGSTLGVYPIAAIVPVAAQSGATVIIMNGSPTEMDAIADVLIPGDLTETLPALLAS